MEDAFRGDGEHCKGGRGVAVRLLTCQHGRDFALEVARLFGLFGITLRAFHVAQLGDT